MAHMTNYMFLFTRLSIGIVGLAITLITLFPELSGDDKLEGWPLGRIVHLLIGSNMFFVAILLSIKPLEIWLMRSFAFRAMSPMSIIFLSVAQAALACTGISITLIVLCADWLGLDPTPGFGVTRMLQLVTGISLLVATFLLHSKPLQRWLADIIGARFLINLQTVVVVIAKIALIVVGLGTIFLAVRADYLGIDTSPGWGHIRTLQLFVGISFVVAALLLQSHTANMWFIRHSGMRLISPIQITIMLIVRVLLAVAGVSVTALVIFADWLGIDPTPGWGVDRFLQLLAGIALLGATFILHNRPLWKWVRRRKMQSKS